MLLVDKDIKALGPKIIVSGYNEANVGPVSYDLTINSILKENMNCESLLLRPQEAVFIKTNEEIDMPNNLMGRIGEKNSRMRQGLMVSGPHYFPGHRTYMFLRVINISSNNITIEKNDKIAQIFFEELIQEPETLYSNQPNASFNEEDEYRGLGNYEEEYEKRIKKIESAKENLEETQNKVYINVMTFMGLFISVFSLITLNFSQFNLGSLTKESILMMNLSLGIVIALFMGLILIFLNKAKSKVFLYSYAALFGTLVLILCFMI